MFTDCAVRIISGGQTGVDRGALRAAIALGFPHGGWCPSGRRADDGRIPDEFQLQECNSTDYHVRTERNVQDADATLILCLGKPSGGTLLTRELAAQHDRLCLVIDPTNDQAEGTTRQWLAAGAVQVLNVAGPRESSWPGAAKAAEEFVRRLLGEQPCSHSGVPR